MMESDGLPSQVVGLKVVVLDDAEVIAATGTLFNEAARSAAEQEQFHSGASLVLLKDEMAWAARVLARPLPAGAASRRASARSAVRELLRCWVSLQGVLREAGRDDSWPDVELAQEAMTIFLRGLPTNRPDLITQSVDNIFPGWTETDGEWLRVRADGVVLLCAQFRACWVAKIAGVFCGEAATKEAAFAVAERQANSLFGDLEVPNRLLA